MGAPGPVGAIYRIMPPDLGEVDEAGVVVVGVVEAGVLVLGVVAAGLVAVGVVATGVVAAGWVAAGVVVVGVVVFPLLHPAMTKAATSRSARGRISFFILAVSYKLYLLNQALEDFQKPTVEVEPIG